MALVLKINGIDRSSSIDWSSLSWTSVLTKEVDRLEFLIKKTASKTIPALNDTIELFEDGVKIFGGSLVERNEKILGGRLIGYECRCKDYSHKLDGKLVTKSYSNQTAKAIVLDIINTFTSGFTTNNVKGDTITVGSIKFNYEQVTRALTQLADQIGWDWYVDADKDIHFFDEETNTAPFNLDDNSGNFEWDTLEINQTVLNLKNHVFVRGGEYKKAISEANAVDKYSGDGTRKTFQLAYRYDNITVKKNGVIQTIGTDQQTDPATVDLLYNFNEKFIKFTNAPANGDTIVVYGNAFIPIIASVRDQISISTYGEFQHAIVDKSITSVGEAQNRAKAELKKFSESVHEAKFKTTKAGLRTGQKITLNSQIRGINKSFKINRINAKARGSDHLEYEVSMIASGDVTFTDIMVGLLGQDKKNITIATNEVLQRLELFAEGLIIYDDAINNYKRSRPYTWGLGGSNDLISPRGWGFGTWG
ncbi:MAG: hypothetical protein KatS3mg101_1103 [Patescibacteria group bacterium]|nr:MAG: hypothetical protein KatS3mg101_1103 [Patescibacteria group bacterium]